MDIHIPAVHINICVEVGEEIDAFQPLIANENE